MAESALQLFTVDDPTICDSRNCKCPIMTWEVANNGMIVTWTEESEEANVARKMRLVKCCRRQVGKLMIKAGRTFSCPACYGDYPIFSQLQLDEFALHLVSEEDTLLKELSLLLDASSTKS
jgi:hypothetical protein